MHSGGITHTKTAFVKAVSIIKHMNKAILSVLAAAIVLVGGTAGAQTYGYSSTACVSISRDLSVGSRGSDVTSLQQFLVSQNYPGGGSWMVTGYYGAATQAAVRNFQSARGIAQTGAVDSVTRSALANCTSYGTSYGSSYSSYPTYSNTYPYSTGYYPYGYNYSSGYSYNYNYGTTYPYSYGVVSISSLSVSSATVGSSVVIYGSNFDPYNNTVYVGSTPVANVSSVNGNSLSFVVPQVQSGTYSVYVSNSRGSSGSLTLTVTNYGNSGCSYPYGYGSNCGGCSYYNCPTGPISITALSPQQGAVGSSVTIYGTGFSTTGNTVRFGNGIITNVTSNDGRAVTFVVPTTLTGYGSQTVYLGTYEVSVTNAAGATSNALSFTVNSLGSSGAPTIQSVSGPSNLSVNSTGVWTVTLNQQSNAYTTVSVRWGDENQYGYNAYTQPQTSNVWGQQTFTFSHAYSQPGTYTATFTASNQSGQQNISSVTVIVSGSQNGQNTLSYVSPSSGRTGTQVALVGTGFTQYGNTVRFGSGGQRDLTSFNGTTIYFTIPAWISPCDPNASVCTMQAIQVTPGTYPISVSNANGQTNTLYFTVTN